MNILVCIKQVPATTQVEVDPETGVLKRDGASSKINPYDLYALEMAFTLKAEHGGRVDVVSMGPKQAERALAEALHMGADSATLISDRRFAGADVMATARVLVGGIRKMGNYDLILCGKQTTDGDTAQVGPEIAELLGLEHASYVLDARIEGESAVVSIDLGKAVQRQKMPMPCLLTVEKDVNTPRLPSYLRSLSVSKDAITTLTLDDFDLKDENLYGLSGSPTQVERIFPPDKLSDRRIFEGSAGELAETAFGILSSGKYI